MIESQILQDLAKITDHDSVEKTLDVLIQNGILCPTFKDDLIKGHQKIIDKELEEFFK